MFGIIYKVTNLQNHKIYIGQTTHSLEQRRALHLTEAKYRPRTHFQYALQKYGADSFLWEQIATAENREELDQLEILYIQRFDSLDPTKGYNGKTGGSRGRNSEAVRQKISDAVRNSEKFQAAMQDPEVRKHRSEVRRGTKHSEDTKRKMSEASRGHHRGLGKRKPQGFGLKVSQTHSGKNNPNVFPLKVYIDQTCLIWEDGFSKLRTYLIQNYGLDISTVGLQRLCKGEYTESRKAVTLGISLRIERKEDANSKG